MKLQKTVCLIDERSKISFEQKKKYIEMLLTPLNTDNRLYKSNFMKIQKIIF